MESLDRLKTIIQEKRPRALEFIQDYDKLRHGRVTAEQFFRAYEAAGVSFTADERAAVVERWTVNCPNGQFISYVPAVKDLETPVVNPLQAAGAGSLAGATASLSANRGAPSPAVDQLLQKLRDGCVSRPIVGKLFFRDFDVVRDGIVTGTNFGRGLSAMYEALFRAYPSQGDIEALAHFFQVQRLKQTTQEYCSLKEVSTTFDLNSITVDYRAFCEAIGATKDPMDVNIKQPKTNDPAFQKFVDVPQDPKGDNALHRLKVAHKKFRFDFKSFLQARDRTNSGTVTYRNFVAALLDAIPDLKRANLSTDELFEVAKKFVSQAQYVRDSRGQETDQFDQDQSKVDFRAFLKFLIHDDNLEGKTLYLAKNHSQDSHPAIQICYDFFHAHPVLLRTEFENFDPRHTGRVDSQQFKQVLAQFMPVHPKDKEEQVQKDKIRQGLDFDQLNELVDLYKVDTTSGYGSVDQFTVSPDKLIGSGFLIDYLTFIKDIDAEFGNFVPSLPQKQRQVVSSKFIAIPPPAQVYFKIAQQLNEKHQQLSDALNQGEAGSAEWNKTSFGQIQIRRIQRSLRNLMLVQLTDADFLSIGLDCADDKCLQVSRFVEGKLDDQHTRVECTEDQLEQYLDQSEVNVKQLMQKVQEQVKTWKPQRTTGYSYNSGRALRRDVVLEAEKQDRDGMDVVFAATKRMTDESAQDLHKLVDVFGPDQEITVKGDLYTLGQMMQAATGDLRLGDTTLTKAAASLLQLYYELHVHRSQPITFFQEFDKLKTGYVTPDQFARSCTTAGIEKVFELFPSSFSALMEVYREKGAGRFQNMIDYAYLLRELGKPPKNSTNIPYDEMTKARNEGLKKATDYSTVKLEGQIEAQKEEFQTTFEGVLEDLAPVCLQVRPKVRDYFLDFDKRRSGACAPEKFGAVLTLMKAKLSDAQVETVLSRFASTRFPGMFEWKEFVTALEKRVGMRL